MLSRLIYRTRQLPPIRRFSTGTDGKEFEPWLRGDDITKQDIQDILNRKNQGSDPLPILIDVRTAEEVAEGSIPTSLHIPRTYRSLRSSMV